MLKNFLLMSTTALLLSACGGGGGGSTENVQLNNGVWAGNINSNISGNLESQFFINNNNNPPYIIARSSTASTTLTDFSINGSDLSVSACVTLFSSGASNASCSLNASNITATTISGNYSNNAGDSGSFNAVAQNNSISPTSVSGLWVSALSDSTIAFTTNAIVIDESSCSTISGAVDTANSTNSYLAYNVTLTGCTISGFNGQHRIFLGFSAPNQLFVTLLVVDPSGAASFTAELYRRQN